MVKVEHLSKYYDDNPAVEDLNFELEENKVYGFLGPNGAGKSTTMNIITGCLAATDGTVTIGEFDLYKDPIRAKRLIGYLPEIPPLYLSQTVKEYLEFSAGLKKIPKERRKEEIESVMARTGASDVQNKLCKALSKGYKQRVGIAQAILGDPKVIILDEPMVGLDPIQIIEIRNLITELGKEHTVILSSHILSEVQAVCEEVMIIAKGKLMAFGNLKELESDHGEDLEKLFLELAALPQEEESDSDTEEAEAEEELTEATEENLAETKETSENERNF